MATSMTSSDISLLREAGAATTGQVGFEGAGPSMRQPSETTPSSAGKKGSTTDPKTSASHLFGCGYCNKTFSRRSEQIRHWVQLNKTCTELKIKYSASLRDTCQRCQTCGLSALTDEECNLHKGESVRVNNLPTGWIRKHPRVSGQDDEALLQGRPRHFAGKERKNIGDPWKLIHVEFREDPNNPRPKKVLKVSRVEQ